MCEELASKVSLKENHNTWRAPAPSEPGDKLSIEEEAVSELWINHEKQIRRESVILLCLTAHVN